MDITPVLQNFMNGQSDLANDVIRRNLDADGRYLGMRVWKCPTCHALAVGAGVTCHEAVNPDHEGMQ